MATEGKKESEAERRKRFALQNEVVALTAAAQSVCLLSVADAATLLNKSPRTLRRARIERDDSLASNRPIDPASLASVPFVPPAAGESEVHYAVSELLGYQRRRVAAARAAVLADDETATIPPVARGFQTWLASAGPEADSAWPFSIQPSGRPVDLFEAIQTGTLTGKSERLGMRQFCERLADAASEQAASSEREALNAATTQHAEPGVKTPSRRRSRRAL